MCRLFRICAILILTALAGNAGIGTAEALSSSEVTDVRISDDVRRVVARANGPLNPVHMYRLEGPGRLAILLPDVGLGDVDRTVCNPKNRALSVKVSTSSAGVKLVLDFGKAAVPEFKIKVMDNCLIALLGPPGSHPADSRDRSFSSAAGAAGSPRSFVPPPRLDGLGTEGTGTADLTVCSAEVINGLVVLNVASKRQGGRTYRIKLGVNFDTLGFSSATISRVPEQSGTPRRVTSGKSSSSMHVKDGGDAFPTVSASPRDHTVQTTRAGSAHQRVSPRTGYASQTAPRGASSRGPVSATYPYPVNVQPMVWN